MSRREIEFAFRYDIQGEDRDVTVRIGGNYEGDVWIEIVRVVPECDLTASEERELEDYAYESSDEYMDDYEPEYNHEDKI